MNLFFSAFTWISETAINIIRFAADNFGVIAGVIALISISALVRKK